MTIDIDEALANRAPEPNKNNPTFDTCIVAGFEDFYFSQFSQFCFMEAPTLRF